MNNEKTIIITTQKKYITAKGYFWLAIKDAYKYKTIKISATKNCYEVFAMVTFLMKANGWTELKEPYKARVKKYKCQKCKTYYDKRIDDCPDCGSKCEDISYMAKIVVLQRLNALECYLQETLEEEKSVSELIDLEVKKHDILEKEILNKW